MACVGGRCTLCRVRDKQLQAIPRGETGLRTGENGQGGQKVAVSQLPLFDVVRFDFLALGIEHLFLQASRSAGQQGVEQ